MLRARAQPCPQGIYGLDFAHNGKTVAIAVGDSTVRVVATPVPVNGKVGVDT